MPEQVVRVLRKDNTMVGLAEEAGSTLKKGGSIMTDVTSTQTTNVTEELTKDALQITETEILDEKTVKKLIARKEGIKTMHDPRAIIRMRDKLDKQLKLAQAHLEGLSKLGRSGDPLEAFEGVSEQKRWKDYLKKLQDNRQLLLTRVSELIKEEEDGIQ